MWSVTQIARLLGLPASRIRAFVRSGLLAPRRDARGVLRFSFQDLVILRAAQGLLAARLPARRLLRALHRLKQQLPAGRGLSGVHLTAEGGRVVARHGGLVWQPESGQVLAGLDASQPAGQLTPLPLRAVAEGADDWFQRGCELETTAPDEAQEAYRRALELDPDHADAHVNLGRLLHEAKDISGAWAHYLRALALQPGHAIAAFNLGVALEDAGHPGEALAQYDRALAADPACADAHFNAARLSERLGDHAAALRHLGAYRRLTRG